MSSLSIRNLRKTFKARGRLQEVLCGISVDFPDKGVIGLLGKNGAGKTTFIKSCVNLISYDGNITYFGKDLQTIQKEGIQTNYFTALFEGNRNIYWKLTPLENVKYFAGLRGVKYENIKKYSLEIMDLLNIKDKSNFLVETLSRGMQQKTALAIALSFNTPIVFLDEPTLGLDLESKNNLIKFFQQENVTKEKLLIISSHDLEFITSVCHEVYFLQKGLLNRYDAILRESTFRILAKQQLNLLEKYRNKNLINGFYYDLPNNLMQLSNLSSVECNKIISITNLKYDLESIILD